MAALSRFVYKGGVWGSEVLCSRHQIHYKKPDNIKVKRGYLNFSFLIELGFARKP